MTAWLTSSHWPVRVMRRQRFNTINILGDSTGWLGMRCVTRPLSAQRSHTLARVHTYVSCFIIKQLAPRARKWLGPALPFIQKSYESQNFFSRRPLRSSLSVHCASGVADKFRDNPRTSSDSAPRGRTTLHTRGKGSLGL